MPTFKVTSIGRDRELRDTTYAYIFYIAWKFMDMVLDNKMLTVYNLKQKTKYFRLLFHSCCAMLQLV